MKWHSEVPKIFSLASRPETAQEILRQVRASDADVDHPLTCEFMERFEADLVKIAAGDVSNIPQDLLVEEAIMQRIPLFSQASEGVHPQSRLVKVRTRICQRTVRSYTDDGPYSRMSRSSTKSDEGGLFSSKEAAMHGRLVRSRFCNPFKVAVFGRNGDRHVCERSGPHLVLIVTEVIVPLPREARVPCRLFDQGVRSPVPRSKRPRGDFIAFHRLHLFRNVCLSFCTQNTSPHAHFPSLVSLRSVLSQSSLCCAHVYLSKTHTRWLKLELKLKV